VRIVGGRLGGRPLIGPKPGAMGVRPTSDRLRESLFNILAARLDLTGLRVLDLFAGTGALSFEAVSRGAAFALMVDDGLEARGLQRANQEALGLGGATRIFRRDAAKLGPITAMEPFDLVFCDPPYRKGLGERALAAALEGGWIAPEAVIILEEAADAALALPPGLAQTDARNYGDTQLLLLRRA
jgi:16S rRNA (guanine966-N2)-methyltransferase